MREYVLGLYEKSMPSELSLREMAFMAKEAGYDFLELSIDETEERLNRLKWNAAMRERYYGIAAQCDKETLLQTHYTPDCMDKRNRYMVDHADYIIAVWDGKPSGTGKTVMYAQSKGKVIIKVNPATLTVERL